MGANQNGGSAPAGLALPIFLVLAAGIGYGSIFAANKIVGEAGFPPIPYVFWQAALGATFLLILSAVTARAPRLDAFSLGHYAASATFGQMIPFLVIAFAAVQLSSGVITLTTTLIPALTYAFAFAVRIERFRWLSVIGIALGIVGVLMIVLPEGGLSGGSVRWMLLALLFPISAATNNIIVAKLRPPAASSVTLAAAVLTVASLVLFPLMLIVNGFTPFWDQGGNVIGGLMWATVIQVIGYFALYEVIQRTGPVLFSQTAYIVVVAGLFWALVLFDESLGNWVWGAVVVLVAGLALANTGAREAIADRSPGA